MTMVHDVKQRPAVTSLRSKDLLGIAEMLPEEITLVLDTADAMKEIATRLGISTRTAETHKYEMMEGLGVETTAELIQYAVKLGLTST